MDYGDGTASTLPNSVHAYPTDGEYTATLYAIKCNDTIAYSKSVTINPDKVLPRANFYFHKYGRNPSGDILLLGNSIKFENTSRYSSSYLWDFGDGSTSTKNSPVHKYTNTGTYDITLTSSCNGNSSTKTKTIEVKRVSKVVIKGLSVDRFPQTDGDEEWDYEEDESVTGSDLKPDVFVKIMKGSCVLYTGSVTNNATSSTNLNWSPNETLTDLDYEYDIMIYDKDGSSETLIGEVTYEPDDHFSVGDYDESITLSEGSSSSEVRVGLKLDYK